MIIGSLPPLSQGGTGTLMEGRSHPTRSNTMNREELINEVNYLSSVVETLKEEMEELKKEALEDIWERLCNLEDKVWNEDGK